MLSLVLSVSSRPSVLVVLETSSMMPFKSSVVVLSLKEEVSRGSSLPSPFSSTQQLTIIVSNSGRAHRNGSEISKVRRFVGRSRKLSSLFALLRFNSTDANSFTVSQEEVLADLGVRQASRKMPKAVLCKSLFEGSRSRQRTDHSCSP